MKRIQRALAEVRSRQRDLLDAYEDGRTIGFDKLPGGLWVSYSESSAGGGQTGAGGSKKAFINLLPRVKAVVVGLDIREYSRRKPEQQLFLTLDLHASIRRAINLLRSASLLPENEPQITIQTGDGAYVVFTFLESLRPFPLERVEVDQTINGAASREQAAPEELDPGKFLEEQIRTRKFRATVAKFIKGQKSADDEAVSEVAGRALSFIFALNAIISRNNLQQRFKVDESSEEADAGNPVFPVECRYAISYDEVLLLYDVNGELNCVGSGMVTCARILSTDHGSHFLVDERLLRDLEPCGGLAALCGGQWGQRLHAALLDEVKVKTGKFRYADVFGFYHDGLLSQALRHIHQAPISYHIGSHDVSSLD